MATKQCNWCGQDMTWVQMPSGRWQAANPDGSAHHCKRPSARVTGKQDKPSPVAPRTSPSIVRSKSGWPMRRSDTT